jgi:riboflavin biosynthesis pyrimidine reductase
MEPVQALEKAKREFGPDVLVEAGPSLLLEYLSAGLIDQLEISITPVTGGEHLIDLNEALRGFEITEDRKVDDTRFVIAKKR